MYTVLIIAVIIVLVLSVVTTSKAYQFKHTVDPVEQDQSNRSHDTAKPPADETEGKNN